MSPVCWWAVTKSSGKAKHAPKTLHNHLTELPRAPLQCIRLPGYTGHPHPPNRLHLTPPCGFVDILPHSCPARPFFLGLQLSAVQPILQDSVKRCLLSKTFPDSPKEWKSFSPPFAFCITSLCLMCKIVLGYGPKISYGPTQIARLFLLLGCKECTVSTSAHHSMPVASLPPT